MPESDSSQNFGDKAQRLAGSLAKHYSTTSTDQQTLQYIVLFIERAEKKYDQKYFYRNRCGLINDESLFKNAKLTLQKLDKTTEGLEDQGPLSILGMAIGTLF